ncbi:hypothetical protein LXL04_005284 [Taraxacum kok-saghyz]
MAFAPPSSFVTFARVSRIIESSSTLIKIEVFHCVQTSLTPLTSKKSTGFQFLVKVFVISVLSFEFYCVCYSNGRTCSTSCSCDECFNRISSALSTEVYSLV